MKNKFFIVVSLLYITSVGLLFGDSQPIMSRLYGDSFVAGVDQYQALGVTGSLDDTWGTSGSLDVSNSITTPQAKAVQTLTDGSVIVLLSSSANNNSYLVKYTATGALYSTTGGTFGTGSISTLTDYADPVSSIVVDTQGRLIIAGGRDYNDAVGNRLWIQRVTSTGSLDGNFTFDDQASWGTSAYAVSVQSSGKIVVIGLDAGTSSIKMGRYLSTGALDTSFGSSGYVLFDGVGGYPSSTAAIVSFAVASDDSIYVAYTLSGTNYGSLAKFNADGSLATGFGTTGIVSFALGGTPVVVGSTGCVLDASGNVVAFGKVGNDINLYCYDPADGTAAGFTSYTITDASDDLYVRDVVATTDGNLLVVGFNDTDTKMRIDSITGAGAHDTDFNGNGILEFSIGSPSTSSILTSGTIAPDGRLFVAGSQVDSGVIAYLSRVFNVPYVSQVAQYPTSTQQGEVDLAFGSNETQDGILRIFNGVYGASLQQKSQTIIELASEKLLVGVSGKLDTSNNSNMILKRLNADGTSDAVFNLTPVYADEYITSVVEDSGTNLYVAGYAVDSPDQAFLRKYDNAGSQTWAANQGGSGYKGLKVALQGSARALLFYQTSATQGAISAYDTSSGSLDTSFNANGLVAGTVSVGDFVGTPLANMGPVYGYAFNVENGYNDLLIAYKNSSTGFVDVARLFENGSGLIEEFGTNGIIVDALSGATPTNVSDLAIATDNNFGLLVAIATADSYKIARYSITTGLLDTSFGSSGIATISSLGTAAVLHKLTILDNGKMLVTGADNATDDSMLVVKLLSTGVLDTTFNAQGSTPGVLSLQVGNVTGDYYARVATDLVVQSSTGDLVISAYEQVIASDATPLVVRVYGESGTTEIPQFTKTGLTDDAGTIDTDFGALSGAHDFTAAIAAGSAKAIYSYPSGNTYQGYMLVGVDTSDSVGTVIARVRQRDLALDTSFGSGSGKITLSDSVAGLQHISIDSENKILVGGSTSGTTAWIRRLTADGIADISFTMPNDFKSVYDIAEQKSGRYIVVGVDGLNQGALVAFRDTGVVDTTFNPLGVVPGIYTISATSALPTVTVNSDDTILIAYSDTAVKVRKLTANGSSLVSSFGSSGEINTAITPTDGVSIRLAIDSNGKVVVASSVGGNSISVVRYTTAGATDSSFNSDGSVLSITGVGAAGVTLARLMTDDNNKIILVGDNTDAGYGANGLMYAARLDSDGALDTAWNVSPTGTDVAGILTYNIASATNSYGATIFIDGRIYVVGLATTNVPVIISIFGDNYAGLTQQEPLALAAGVVDTTLDGTAGALDLDVYLSSLDLSASTAKKIYIYDDGSMLLGFNQGTTTVIVKLKKDLSLDTSFGTSGATTIATADTLLDMFVNNGTNGDGHIYLMGLHGTALWTESLDADGAEQSVNVPNSLTMSGLTTIRRTTNSRTLITGLASSAGTIASYKSDGSELDLSFGSGTGYYTTGVSTKISDMQLDAQDTIYIVYADGAGTSINVDRVLPNGTGLDSWSAFGTNISVTTATTIKLALDQANNQLVVAVQDGTGAGNTIRVRRYNATTGADTGDQVNISVASKALNLSELFIDSDQNIYVAGYNSTDSNVLVARIASTSATTIALDSSYGSAGIANVSAGSNLTIVRGAALHPDRRVYVIGVEGTPTPAMARLYGDVYPTQVSKANEAGVTGFIDLTFDEQEGSQDGGIVIAGLTGYAGRSVYTNTDGSCLIAFGNGTNLKVGKFDGDFNLDTSFGDAASGVTAALAMATVNSLIVDAEDRIVVSGTTTGGSQKVVRFSADGTTTTTVFTSTLSCTVGNQAVEQKSGRILVAGKKGSSGTINAYKSDGSGDDVTYGSESNIGFYVTGVDTPVDDMVVDLYDNIYIAYRDASNNVVLEKIVPSGSRKVTTFNSGLAVTTTIVATQPVRMAINNDGNILVGATTDSSTIKTALYNGTTGTIIGSVQSISIANTPILTDMTGCSTDFVASVYTTDPSMKVVKILGADGTVDSAFGTSGVGSATSETATAMYGIAVQPDGRILMTGTDGSDPVTMRYYGNPYQAPYAQYPGAAIVGSLDTTLYPTSGALNLDTLLSSGGLDLDASKVTRMYEYGNGVMLLVCENATDTIVVRMKRDLTLDTTFNTNGYVTIAGKIDARGLVVTTLGEIVVAGGATESWVRAFNSDGSTLTGWSSPTENLTGGAYEVAKQSNDRVILVGQNTNGTLYGYTNGGILDPSFGTAGVVTTGVPFSIADLSIDFLDRIVIVSSVMGGSVLKRISSDGDTITSLSGTALSNITGNEVKVIHDTLGNIIVAAATTTGFKLRRYDSDGVDSGSQITITAGGSSTSHLGNVYVTSDNKIVLVGYETTGGNVIVARIEADFSGLDSTFNSGEILSTTVGNMDLVYDGTIHTDGTIMIAGGSSVAADPYMARVIGDDYVTVVDQFPTEGIAGTIDETFETSGAFSIGSLDSSITNSQPHAVVAENDGGHYIAFSDGSSASQVIKITSSNTLDDTYGAPSLQYSFGGGDGYIIDPRGVFSSASFFDKATILVQSDGKFIVGAINSGSNAYIARYTATGDLDLTFNAGGTPGYVVDTNGIAGLTAVLQSDGKIIIACESNTGYGYIARYTSAGVLDSTFNAGDTPGYVINNDIWTNIGLAVQSDGKILIVGRDGSNDFVYIARYTSAGVLDSTFNSGGTPGYIIDENAVEGTAIALQSDGKIIVTGTDDNDYLYIARYTSAGALDSTFNSGGTPGYIIDTNGYRVYGILVQSDGKILVTGNSASSRSYLARYTSTGVLDSTFNSGGTPGYIINNSVRFCYDLVVQSDGKIIDIGVSWGTYKLFIQRYTSSGTIDNTFAGGINTNVGQGLSVALTADEKILALCSNSDYTALYIPQYATDGTLDTSSTLGGAFPAEAPLGVSSMFLDGLDRAVLTGTDGSGAGWVQRYGTDGDVDSTFGSSGVVAWPASTIAHSSVELSFGRLVVAGKNTNGVLRAYTNTGTLDTSFNSLGATPGEYSTGITNGIYALAGDSNDRLIIAYLNGTNIDLARLRSSGVLDTSFGTGGIVSSIITDADEETQVRLVLNSAGNIVVAAHINDGADKVAVVSYDNLSAASGNGVVVNAQYDISGLTTPVLTDMIATQDGKVLILGTQSGTNPMWIARIELDGSSAAALDTAGFNPDAIGGTAGIFNYAGNGSTGHPYNAIAARYDGRISIVGSELSGSTHTPYLLRMYNSAYDAQESQSPNSQPVGSNDITLGLAGQTEVTFYALSETEATTSAQLQVARAVALQDANRYIIALDGQSTEDTASRIFLNSYNIDGTLDTTFNSTGQIEVLPHTYEQEYVTDMITFTTAEGVNKAIIAGYAVNTTLSVTNSLLMQYNLSTPALDGSFGGLNGNPSGVAFGDGQTLQVIGRQSSGRIIGGGLDQSDNGLLFAYTTAGKLDKSFGSDGCFVQGATGIYSHAIDSLDRVVVCYNDGSDRVAVARVLADGSGLDTSFGTAGIVAIANRLTGISGNSNFKVAVDSDNKVIVAVINNSGVDCVVRRYNSNGSVDVSLTVASADLGTITALTISKLLIDAAGKITVVGYDDTTTDQIVIFRTNIGITALDTTFNPTGTPGYIKYNNGVSQAIIHALVHPDGRIMVVGSQG